jgi:hypothetical protein
MSPTAHPDPLPADVLFFVDFPWRRGRKGAACFWSVEPTTDYGAACQRGREYAIELAQYFRLAPFWVGANTLGEIVRAMDHAEDGPTKGYAVGFFAQLETYIARGAAGVDLGAELLRTRADHLAFEADRQATTEEDDA